MNVFIVYAHPEPKSFDGVMFNHAVSVLTGMGHAVQLSDLYRMRFRPTVTTNDFTEPSDALIFDLQREQAHAARSRGYAPDILAEQQKLLWCDTLIFQFPLWWYSVPAIMKGWIDRVLAYGFAYGQGQSLIGRRAMCVLTTGGAPHPYTPEKREAISRLLDHLLRGTLHFCGMDVLPPFAVYGAVNTTEQQRDQFLIQYTQILRTLETITPIDFSR